MRAFYLVDSYHLPTKHLCGTLFVFLFHLLFLPAHTLSLS